MDRNADENAIRGKALGKALTGGLCGLGAALAFAAAAALAFNAAALGQAPVDRPALASALEDCESGARQGAETGRALGACDVLMRSGDLDDAQRARVLVNRGLIAMDRGIVREGRADLEQAVRLDPDLAEAWLNLAAARIKAGAASEALDAARRAGDLGAPTALARFNEAIALEALGRYDAAYEAYTAAADADPANATLQAQPRRFRRHQAGDA
ncbi:MAG: hypothetical protein ACFE0P_13520 [Oceanicaulis sp.]